MENIYYDWKSEKPLWYDKNGNAWVCIRDIHIQRAIKNKQFLRINTPKGISIVAPKEWKRQSKVMKKVFLIKDRPMKLYCSYLIIPKKKTNDEEVAAMARSGVFG